MSFEGVPSKKYSIQAIRKGLEEMGPLHFEGYKHNAEVSLHNFVLNYFKLQSKHVTYDADDEYEIGTDHRRSFVDLYRTCMYYYPGCTVLEVRKSLAEHFAKKKLSGDWCSVPDRWVMWFDKSGYVYPSSIELDNTMNEFGWRTRDWLSLEKINKNKCFQAPEPAQISNNEKV